MDDPCYDGYLSLCRPFTLAPPWDLLPAHPGALRGPADSAAALAILLERHGRQTMVDNGLARVGNDGSLTICPLLESPDVPLVVLRDPNGQGVTEIMTSAGSVFGRRRPFMAALHDAHTRKALDAHGHNLLLTGDLADTILLRSLGMAAAPISGLENLDQECLESLRTLFGVPCSLSSREANEREDAEDEAAARSPAPMEQRVCTSDQTAPAIPESEPQGADEPIKLVVVNWSPQELSLDAPENLRAAIQHLEDLKQHRRLDLKEIDVWKPRVESLESIRFGLERREATWVRDALLDSLDADYSWLDQLGSLCIAPAESLDLATAAEKVFEALGGRDEVASQRARQEAEACYRRLASEELVKPLLLEAQAACDPMDRIQMTQLAELTRVFLAKWPSAMAAMLSGTSDSHEPGRGRDSPLTDLLAISYQMSTLVQQGRKCKRYPVVTNNRRSSTLTGKTLGTLALPLKS
jgi:hypothetical protein